jgi:hypothetical protein
VTTLNHKCVAIGLILLVWLWSGNATVATCAEQKAAASEHDNAASQANNPLANMTALNIQNYYIGDLSDSDEDANQFWVRFAQPFSRVKPNGSCGPPCR